MRIEKTQLLNDVNEIISNADYLYFVSYKGLTVAQFRELRSELKKNQAICKVLKNSLIEKAAAKNGLSALVESSNLVNDTAVVFGKGDAGAVAKVLDKFSQTNECMTAKCGYVEGAFLGAADVKEIADLPSREALYAQFLGVLNAPAQNFVSVLNQATVGIVNVVNAYKNKLEENKA